MANDIKRIFMMGYTSLKKNEFCNPHRLIRSYMLNPNHKDVWEIIYAGRNLLETNISNPKNDIAILFVNRFKKYGLLAHRWYVMIGDRLFQRISLSDIGATGTSGLKARRNGNTVHYLWSIDHVTDEDKEKIMLSLDELIMKEK